MNTAQKQTLATHIRANTDPVVVAALAIRDDDTIRDWYNVLSATNAWRSDVGRLDLFEGMNINQFDTVSAGKRDAWRLLLEQAALTPLDFGRQKLRNAVADVWSVAQAESILTNACTRKASVGELIFGGTEKTTLSITATDLAFEIVFTSLDISLALNEFPA